VPPTADDDLGAGARDASQVGDPSAREEGKGRAISREALERAEKLGQSKTQGRRDKTKSSHAQNKQSKDTSELPSPIPSHTIGSTADTLPKERKTKTIASSSISSKPSRTPTQDEKDDSETIRPPKRVKTAASKVVTAPKPTNEGDTNSNNNKNGKNEKGKETGKMMKKEEKKKKKKTKKGGDEFDDLFKDLF
jgi:hypothetical protein